MFSLITRISVRKKAPRDPYESEFGLPTSGYPILSLLMTRRRKPWRLFEPSKVLRYTDNLAVNFVLMSFYLVKSSMAACLECKLLMKVGGLDVETFLNCSYIAHAAQELVQERTLARKYTKVDPDCAYWYDLFPFLCLVTFQRLLRVLRPHERQTRPVRTSHRCEAGKGALDSALS
jgi:hypothetical protein